MVFLLRKYPLQSTEQEVTVMFEKVAICDAFLPCSEMASIQSSFSNQKILTGCFVVFFFFFLISHYRKCLKYREKLVAEVLSHVAGELTKHLHLPKCWTFRSVQTYSKIITKTECQGSLDIISLHDQWV